MGVDGAGAGLGSVGLDVERGERWKRSGIERGELDGTGGAGDGIADGERRNRLGVCSVAIAGVGKQNQRIAPKPATRRKTGEYREDTEVTVVRNTV
jgi:hypothetical protein